MTRRLIHYSREPLAVVRSVEQDVVQSRKPNGLWVSAEGDDDWKRWCSLDEDFRPENLLCESEVTVRPGARVLTVQTVEELDAFNLSYSADYFGQGEAIDWREVARRWQGIVIAPYQWERRLSLGWYYPWDCASGCFWDADAVGFRHHTVFMPSRSG